MSSPSTTKKRRLHDGDSGAPVTGSSGRLAEEGKRLRVLPRRTGHTQGRELSKLTSTDVICVDNSSSDSDAYYQPSSRAVKRNPHRANTSTLADLTDSFDVTASDIPSSNDAASSTQEASTTSASHAADETGPDVPSPPQGGATATQPLRPGPRVPPSSKPVASSKTTKIKLVRPDCVRDGVPFFRWRDESIRRAPPSPWDFPHTSAQALWLFWFHGNGHVGPLVHLTSEDVAQCSKRGKMRWALAQRLIAVLVDAVDAAHTVAMGSLSIKSSVHLFETAFAKVLRPAGLEPKVFVKKTFVEVGEALSSALKAAGPLPPTSSISSASGPPPPLEAASATATPTPATDGGRAMFVWTDGSNHRVPESWTFRDAPCHDVWTWWFKGSGTIRPYRELGNSDMPSEVEWSNLARCRLVMDTMEAVVEANGMTVEAVAKLPTPEFRLVFDSTLVQLLQLSRRPALDSVATRAGRLSFARLYYFLIAMEPPTEPTSAWCGWFFPWSDRSVRRTPEHAWTFPPNASVRQVWWWWFHGDPVNRMCPYRLFTDHDLWPRYVSQLADCRAVMNALFELAASCFGLVQDNMSSLPPAVFETAVHKACAILLHEHEALRHRFQSPVQVANAPVSIVSRVLYDSAALRPGWHRWQDGSVRRVPESWTLPPPTTSVVQMWTWWFHGDGDANLGPFRNLKPSDMPGKLTQERYAAVTYVMSTLEAIASGPLRLVPPGTDVADLPVWESLAVLHAMLKHSPTAHAKMPFTSVLVAMQQHVLGATLVVDSRGRPLHRWSDKSLRRAPEHWTFEDAPCRLMWLYWFLGNPDTYVGPFRKLTAQDLGPASVAASTAAAVVMEFVTAAAVQFNQLKDPTKAINMAKLNASKSLLKVFDNTVRVIGVGRLQGMADMRCTDVYAILQTSASTAQHVEPGSDPSRVDATAVTDRAMPSQKSPDVAAVAVAVEQQGELPPPKPSNDPSRHTMALQNPEAMAVDLSVLTCVTLWEWWFHGTPHNPETPTASRKPLRDKAATSSDDAAALAMSHAIVQEMELVAHDLGLLSERPADGVPAPSRQETRSVAVRAWDAFRLRLGGEVVEAATCLDVLVALTTHDPTASRRKVSRFFRWPTGIYRRTPPTWCFVPTTCWILWLHWFLGDDDAGIGPFRLLQPSDVEDPELLTMAKTTMDTLVRLTGTAVVQLADMDERALVALYEQASGKLYLQLPGDARANILNNRLQGLTVDRWNFDVVAALLRASSGTK
ncbi:hypothetical protein DYB28_003361 [Aphanomyces astaci]|uniref:Uncharacterized protein n=1 Tax=Aphanomyces astaci TaxID=112090 RepID=A0A9X8E289_APHAT|nr:hypothetical protein DYB28_003361 [Aphanomyces astaci]